MVCEHPLDGNPARKFCRRCGKKAMAQHPSEQVVLNGSMSELPTVGEIVRLLGSSWRCVMVQYADGQESGGGEPEIRVRFRQEPYQENPK